MVKGLNIQAAESSPEEKPVLFTGYNKQDLIVLNGDASFLYCSISFSICLVNLASYLSSPCPVEITIKLAMC